MKPNRPDCSIAFGGPEGLTLAHRPGWPSDVRPTLIDTIVPSLARKLNLRQGRQTKTFDRGGVDAQGCSFDSGLGPPASGGREGMPRRRVVRRSEGRGGVDKSSRKVVEAECRGLAKPAPASLGRRGGQGSPGGRLQWSWRAEMNENR